MNIIVPIAGPNKSVNETEYIKSLQEIERKTVLQYTFEYLKSLQAEHTIVIIKREDAVRYHLDDVARLMDSTVEVVIAEGQTMGAACTCMLAIDRINLDEPLLIAGSDQMLTVPPERIVEEFRQKNYDGGVVVFDDIHPRWSFVRVDENDLVIEAAEKRPISRNASAGLYYFKQAGFFFESAKRMILKDAQVDGSYYICPVYNEMILQQKNIGVYRIDKQQYFNFKEQVGMDAYKSYLQKQRTVGASDN